MMWVQSSIPVNYNFSDKWKPWAEEDKYENFLARHPYKVPPREPVMATLDNFVSYSFNVIAEIKKEIYQVQRTGENDSGSMTFKNRLRNNTNQIDWWLKMITLTSLSSYFHPILCICSQNGAVVRVFSNFEAIFLPILVIFCKIKQILQKNLKRKLNNYNNSYS